MMTKRNVSEYIIGSIQRYPRAILSSPAGLSSVWHGGLVGLVLRTRVEWSPVVVVAASLCELHSSGAACSKYNIHTGFDDPACNIPMRYTDARDAYVCA